jgi:DNA-binding winged helix-turn-helix (wHTH) protein
MFVWKGEYMSLKDVDQSIHHISKHVYYTTEDVVINGRTIIKAGHGFVLCSDVEEAGNERELLEKFVEGELKDEPEGKISLLYTSSPGVSIDEYLYNFA